MVENKTLDYILKGSLATAASLMVGCSSVEVEKPKKADVVVEAKKDVVKTAKETVKVAEKAIDDYKELSDENKKEKEKLAKELEEANKKNAEAQKALAEAKKLANERAKKLAEFEKQNKLAQEARLKAIKEAQVKPKAPKVDEKAKSYETKISTINKQIEAKNSYIASLAKKTLTPEEVKILAASANKQKSELENKLTGVKVEYDNYKSSIKPKVDPVVINYEALIKNTQKELNKQKLYENSLDSRKDLSKEEISLLKKNSALKTQDLLNKLNYEKSELNKYKSGKPVDSDNNLESSLMPGDLYLNNFNILTGTKRVSHLNAGERFVQAWENAYVHESKIEGENGETKYTVKTYKLDDPTKLSNLGNMVGATVTTPGALLRSGTNYVWKVSKDKPVLEQIAAVSNVLGITVDELSQAIGYAPVDLGVGLTNCVYLIGSNDKDGIFTEAPNYKGPAKSIVNPGSAGANFVDAVGAGLRLWGAYEALESTSDDPSSKNKSGVTGGNNGGDAFN